MDASIMTILHEMKEMPEFVGVHLDGPNVKGNFGDYPLHVAVTMGNMEYVQALIEAGADVNQKGEHGYTALHDAVEQDNCDIAEILLKNGADISVKNNDELSGFRFAEMTGSDNMKNIISRYLGSE